MMEKYGCLAVILLVAHGATLSMMHGRKIISKTSSLKLQRRTFYDLAFDGKVADGRVISTIHAAGLKEREDAALLRIQSIENIQKSVSDIENKLKEHDQLLQNQLLQKGQDSLMDMHDKTRIRDAYIDSIYKVAQIEAMCKIYAMSNSLYLNREYLLYQVRDIVKE